MFVYILLPNISFLEHLLYVYNICTVQDPYLNTDLNILRDEHSIQDPNKKRQLCTVDQRVDFFYAGIYIEYFYPILKKYKISYASSRFITSFTMSHPYYIKLNKYEY
jgi:hypothetical protein